MSEKLTGAERVYVDRQRAWCESFTRKLVLDGVLRADTNTALFTRSLAQILAKPFDRRLAPIETLEALPSVPAIDPAVETVYAQGHEVIGEAFVTRTYNTEIPRVELVGREHGLSVYGVAAKWFLGYQQIAAAAYANVPLEAKLRSAADRVIREHVDQTLAYGNASAGLTGAWTNANVNAVGSLWRGAVTVSPINGVLLNGAWANAATTDAQVLSDVNEMYQQCRQGLKIYKPDTLAVGPSEYARLIMPVSTVTYGPGSLRDLIERHYPIKVIELARLSAIPAAYTVATTVQPRAVMYEKSDEVLMPYVTPGPEEFPPVQMDAGYSIAMHWRTAGVEVLNPLGIVYLDMA